MSKQNRNGMVSRSASRESFLLLKPNAPSNSDELARKLALCRGVREVRLTSGDYGFIVAARHDLKGRTSRRIRRIARNSRMSVAVNHYVYRYRTSPNR